MKTEEFLSDDFLKQFKTADQLNDFLAQIQKRGIEKMLKGELDSHLGYDKHGANSRNGYRRRKLRPAMVNQR
ncbi:transposase [Chitinophaga silvatica]|uniref:transposase n=1 Tax=Chitinophaga silvatica TaxID=2282649 RepID=UPI001F430608|nr:transposase [Chitinophaga silvatica]